MDRDMVGKIFTFGFVVLTLVSMLGAATTDCTDGTKYYACSSKQPGYACLPESTLRNTIQKVIGPDAPAALRTKCACSNFPGYVELNGECVKTTCTSGGQTYNNFACVQGSPPNQCLWGQILANSSVCGCPTGQKASLNNKDCENRIGCRWGTLPTPSGKDCKFNSNNAEDDGTLVSKQGCAWGTVTCQWNEDCDTSKNVNGSCKLKTGCQYNNPMCTSGFTCNQVSGVCEKSADTSVPVVSTLPSSNTTGQASGGNSNPLCCCPLPAAGAAAAVSLVSYQKLRRKEEE